MDNDRAYLYGFHFMMNSLSDTLDNLALDLNSFATESHHEDIKKLHGCLDKYSIEFEELSKLFYNVLSKDN